MSLLLLLACTSATIRFGDKAGVVDSRGGDDSVVTVDDTAPIDDTAAIDDTAPIDDTGDTQVSSPEVTYRPTGHGAEGSTLSLYRLNSDFTIAEGGPGVTAPFDGGVWGVTYTPSSDEYGDGVNYVIYAAFANDSEGALIGASTWLTMYVDGVPGDDLANLGFVSGWNGFRVLSSTDTPTGVAPFDLDLPFNLVSVDAVTVSGTWSGPVSAGYRLAVYPYTGTGAMMYDGTLPASWSVSLTGRPADTALSENNGILLGGGTLLAYKDADGSRSVTMGDSSLATGLLDSGENVGLLWVDAVSDVGTAFALVVGAGLHTGWGAYAINEGERARELDATEGSSVRLDP